MKAFPWNMFHLAVGNYPKNVMGLSLVVSSHPHNFQGLFTGIEANCYGITIGLLFYEFHFGVLV